MTVPALAARGLSATHRGRFGDTVALHGVSLTIAAGEAVAVVGRSGCGKTTLGRLLAGLPPAGASVSGELAWPGAVAPVAEARRRGLGRHVAWLPQEGIAALHPQLTIGAQVAETLRAHGTDADAGAVARALAAVELDPALARRHPHGLSGGQGQRVALACALAQAPAVLVADEPTSALDDETGQAILRLLAAARRDRGMALVLVTHDLAAALPLCDRMLVLQYGGLAEEGATAAVMAMPQTGATLELLRAMHPDALRAMHPEPRCSARAA